MATSTTVANGPLSGGGGSGTLTSLNALTAAAQLFAVGTAGTDFAVSSASDTHTFNLPSASATARGVVTTGSQTIAGVKTFSDTTDATSETAAGLIGSGGLAIAKKIWAGTGINVTTGNVLITSGNVGRDTGVSGSLTDCPTNIFCNQIYIKSGIGWVANSATAGLACVVNSSSSVCLIKNGATEYVTCTTTQNYIRARFELGAATNTVWDWCSGSTTTTDAATPQNLWTYDATGHSNWVWNINFSGLARRSDSGTEIYYFDKRFCVSMPGGTLTLDESAAVVADKIIGGGAPTVTCDFSGNTIRIRATGEASETWKWFWRIEFVRGSA